MTAPVEQLEKHLPEQLRSLPRFLVWKSLPGTKPGKVRKVPFYASGAPRNGLLDTDKDLSQLVSFEQACDALMLADYAGIGFAVGDGVAAFDLDDCLSEHGNLKQGHQGYDLVMEAKKRGAYVEVSPSRRGLRIIGPCKSTEAYSAGGLEYWGARRFVTLTGDPFKKPGGWVALDDLRTMLPARQTRVEREPDDEGPIITARNIDELRDALSAIDADERNLWIRMGMALKTLPADKGKALWFGWSQKSEKYDAADAERVWESLVPEATSFRAVFAEADRWGWRNPRKKHRNDAPLGSLRSRQIDLGDEPVFYPTEFVLDGFLPVGVSVIAGAWGAGKSTCLIPLMASVAHLAPEKWGFRPDLRRAVIWVTEADGQARDTLVSIHKAEGSAGWQDFCDRFLVFASERKSAKEIADEVKAEVEALTWTTDNGFRVKPVVVLDTTTANLDLESENDNAQVGAAMSILKQALRDTPLVLIGHTPKALVRADIGEMTFRGAGAWEAEAAATYFLVHDEETDARFLAIRKCRFTPTYREVNFETEGGSVMVETPWGAPQHKSYLHGVPRKSNGEERKAAKREIAEQRREERVERSRSEREGRIMAFVRECAADGRLATKTLIRETVVGKKTDITDAVERLIEAGALTVYDLDAWPPGAEQPGRKPTVILPAEIELDAFLARFENRSDS